MIRERQQPSSERRESFRRISREPSADDQRSISRETRHPMIRERLQPMSERRGSFRRTSFERRESEISREVREGVPILTWQRETRNSIIRESRLQPIAQMRRANDGLRISREVRERVQPITERRLAREVRERDTARADRDLRERQGQYGSRTAARLDINNNLEENSRKTNERRFDPFGNEQNFQRRVVETEDGEKRNVEDSERATPLNATFMPQDKINALVNAVQAVLMTFLLGGILENTKTGKLGWSNLKSLLHIKEKIF
ncbi:uncharacterized protein LOC126746696 [Anthonomus grandis grandis]|uniref:uncharacterized protein LOC126746696 n=1 Tax=Anthonomus grandis grandis TaxID=2921223 RepID=UPI0021658768|nr:uncharacterized protein LOC126746696 [Anthonomus grandis grandis]